MLKRWNAAKKRQTPTRTPYSCQLQLGRSGMSGTPVGAGSTWRAMARSISHSSRLTIGQTMSRRPLGSVSGVRSTMAEKGARSRGFMARSGSRRNGGRAGSIARSAAAASRKRREAYDARVAMAGKDSGNFLTRRRLAQRGADLGHHARPVATPGLAKEALAGIPGIVGAGAMVAPVRQEGQRHPARAAERTGQMRDRCVHRDHQVEHGYRRRRLGEIGQVRAEIDEAIADAVLGELGHARADLRIVEPGARRLEPRPGGRD